MALLSTQKSKRAILDLKVSEIPLIRKTNHIARRLGVDMNALTFIVWNRMASAPPTRATVLRAVGYSFRTCHHHVDGIACKYDGSAVNRACIERALDEGVNVNMWPPNPRKIGEMAQRYGNRCTLTVDM